LLTAAADSLGGQGGVADSVETDLETKAGTQAKDALVSEIARLAATHAALDPGRLAWRHDILVSACIEILSVHGPLTTAEVATAVNTVWATTSIAETLVEQALAVAREAGLLFIEDRPGERRWNVTEDATREAREDRAWAAAIIDEFKHDFTKRLVDCCDRPIKSDRHENLFVHFTAALARGVQGIYEVAAASQSLKEIEPVRSIPRLLLRTSRRTWILVPSLWPWP
jgi:hypothetical protein